MLKNMVITTESIIATFVFDIETVSEDLVSFEEMESIPVLWGRIDRADES